MIKNNLTVKIPGNKTTKPVELTVLSTGESAHFDFVKDMKEWSPEERQRISQLIYKSLEKPSSSGTGSSSAMHCAQTIAQLQLIADKLNPEQYKNQMNEAIKGYQKEGYDF